MSGIPCAAGWGRTESKLLLRAQIEEAAAAWHAETRTEIRRELVWPEARIVDAVKEIARSGVSLDDVKDRVTVDAFLGPTAPKDLEALPGLAAVEDETAGGGYGEAWRLPLGHEARASVGVRLALLGDRRKGGLRADGLPDIDWRRIEGGEVTIQVLNEPVAPAKGIKEEMTRTVPAFWMARYPVTITQFRAFLEGCYRNGQWSLPPGSPFDLGAWGWPPPKPRARYGNHPMDGVNWFDASVFCHWLGTRLGFEVRLPTELSGSWPPPAATPDASILGARTGTRSKSPGGRTPWRASLDAPRRSACTPRELRNAGGAAR